MKATIFVGKDYTYIIFLNKKFTIIILPYAYYCLENNPINLFPHISQSLRKLTYQPEVIVNLDFQGILIEHESLRVI